MRAIIASSRRRSPMTRSGLGAGPGGVSPEVGGRAGGSSGLGLGRHAGRAAPRLDICAEEIAGHHGIPDGASRAAERLPSKLGGSGSSWGSGSGRPVRANRVTSRSRSARSSPRPRVMVQVDHDPRAGDERGQAHEHAHVGVGFLKSREGILKGREGIESGAGGEDAGLALGHEQTVAFGDHRRDEVRGAPAPSKLRPVGEPAAVGERGLGLAKRRRLLRFPGRRRSAPHPPRGSHRERAQGAPRPRSRRRGLARQAAG